MTRENVILLTVSLVLAFVTWLAHSLTQDKVAYLQYQLVVTSNIPGYGAKSVAREILPIGCTASGFHILARGNKVQDLEVKVDAKYFTEDAKHPDVFHLDPSRIVDQLDDALGSEITVNHVSGMSLTFEFVPRIHKKVPVVSRISYTCRPQYMATSELVLEPDSVDVYGDETLLESVTSVLTRQHSIQNASKTQRGYVQLEKRRGIRIEPDAVAYSLPVTRYVETTFPVDLTAIGVPSNRRLSLMPSRADVTVRVPFGTDISPLKASGAFSIYYKDFLNSRSALVAPRLRSKKVQVLSYSFEPRFVECVLVEDKR